MARQHPGHWNGGGRNPRRPDVTGLEDWPRADDEERGDAANPCGASADDPSVDRSTNAISREKPPVPPGSDWHGRWIVFEQAEVVGTSPRAEILKIGAL
jgi:hypothetical protein